MTNIVTPAPTPVFVNVDGVNAPEAATSWSVQSPTNGSNQNTVTGGL